MTTDNIFGNNILNGDLTTSLVPELGQENILIDVTPSETSLVDPLNQELSLVEQEVAIDEINIDNNTSQNNVLALNSISVANIDPLTAANAQEFQVNNVSASNALFTPPGDKLQLQGGFGDYDGGNDVKLEVENEDGAVVETYSLKGKGQASLYRDDEDGKAYVFFSGTDESTIVEISAKSNIQFDSYIGDSLEIETTGSIDAGSVTLNNPDETGLILKSGTQGREENLEILGYDVVHLGAGLARGINNRGDVIVKGHNTNPSYIYSNKEINYISSGLNKHFSPNAINDLGQVVGSYFNPDNKFRAFLSSGGSINDLGVFPEAETYEWKTPEGAVIELPYLNSRSVAKAINNNGQIVGVSHAQISNYSYEGTSYHAFISNGSSLTDLHEEINAFFAPEENSPYYTSQAHGINDLGQVVGSYFDGHSKAFVYGGGQNINLHGLLIDRGYTS